MAIYCNTCLGALCDHCRWYDFNAEEDGGYAGNGYCRLRKEPRDPLDACEGFHCKRASPGNRFTEPARCHR